MPSRIATAGLTAALITFCACSGHRETPLMTAAARGDLQEITRLLASGTDVNEHDQEGCTALQAAARNGRLKTIALLLRRGADPNSRGGVNGWTPVMHAIHKRQREAALALLDAGADPNAKARGGSTPLIMAAGYGDAKMVTALLDRGADPRLEGAHGQTALSAAVGGVPDIDKFTLGKCQTETVRALVERAPGLKLNQNFSNRVAFQVARWGGCTDVIQALANAR